MEWFPLAGTALGAQAPKIPVISPIVHDACPTPPGARAGVTAWPKAAGRLLTSFRALMTLAHSSVQCELPRLMAAPFSNLYV